MANIRSRTFGQRYRREMADQGEAESTVAFETASNWDGGGGVNLDEFEIEEDDED